MAGAYARLRRRTETNDGLGPGSGGVDTFGM
jgi:hypothetical protein